MKMKIPQIRSLGKIEGSRIIASKINIGPNFLKKVASLQQSVNCECCVVGIEIDALLAMRLDPLGPLAVRKSPPPFLAEVDKKVCAQYLGVPLFLTVQV